MNKNSNFINNIISWLNEGTKDEILIKKILVIGLTLLLFYKFGYAIGVFLAHINL